MASDTSFEDVEEAVRAVKVIQEQLASLVEVVTRLAARLEAIEAK